VVGVGGERRARKKQKITCTLGIDEHPITVIYTNKRNDVFARQSIFVIDYF
jgi:hypothetical protein